MLSLSRFNETRRSPVLLLAMLASLASPLAQGQASTEEVFNLLATGTGVELGIGAFHNEYKEHIENDPDFMHQSGRLYDLQLDGHITLDSELYIKAIVRLGDARFDYSGSGTASDHKDRINDTRLLVGKDFFPKPSLAISPYIGVGSRNLSDDSRGRTSIGAIGYRRDSQYIYVPIGASIRFQVGNEARINTTLEYDYVQRGWQKSHLSDTCRTLYDVVNRQSKGHGLHGSIAYEKDNWSLGPVIERWNISESNWMFAGRDCTSQHHYISAQEPANHTTEYGVRAAYIF